jgi:hypothetical protein
VPEEPALLDTEKAEALAEELEVQFQPVHEPLESTVIEVVSEAMRAYDFATETEPP